MYSYIKLHMIIIVVKRILKFLCQNEKINPVGRFNIFFFFWKISEIFFYFFSKF